MLITSCLSPPLHVRRSVLWGSRLAATAPRGPRCRHDTPHTPPALRKKFLLLMPRAVTGWFCKNEVSAVLLFCFSPARYKVQPVAQRFCNSFSIFCCPGCGADCCLRPIGQRPNRMWPGWDQRPRPRSVWSGLSLFFNILIETRAAPPRCCSVRRPGQAHIDGSAGFLPCQPGRQCTGPRRSSSFARHDTLASSPQLLIKRRLSAGCTGRDVASMEKRLYEQSSDVVLQALVDAR